MKNTLGAAGKDFVKPLEDKKDKILAQAVALEKIPQTQVESKLATLRAHVVAPGEIKVLDDLSKGRFVAAKMQQDTLRKERKLNAFSEAYLNASFFHRLGAWNEAGDALQTAEEQLSKVQVAGDMR
jgi:ABC-type cobalamin/Fe3+-siderophores transport system ATPase subunit